MSDAVRRTRARSGRMRAATNIQRRIMTTSIDKSTSIKLSAISRKTGGKVSRNGNCSSRSIVSLIIQPKDLVRHILPQLRRRFKPARSGVTRRETTRMDQSSTAARIQLMSGEIRQNQATATVDFCKRVSETLQRVAFIDTSLENRRRNCS